MKRIAAVVSILMFLTLVARAQLPVVTQVAPQAASAGDVIVIRGSFGIPATHVRFIASVGGFLGVDTRIVAVLSTTPTEVQVVVPTMAGFAPPLAAPPGNPFGTVEVRDQAGSISAPMAFYFHQGSYSDPSGSSPGTATHGQGSTNSLGYRAAASFDVPNGPPDSTLGNLAFGLTLENVPPFSAAVLVGGLPAMPPSVAYLDGLVAVDLGQPVVLYPQPPAFLVADATGRLVQPLPIPPGPYFLTFTVFWVYVDSISGLFQISSGMTLNI